jgi:hypothetical protein
MAKKKKSADEIRAERAARRLARRKRKRQLIALARRETGESVVAFRRETR